MLTTVVEKRRQIISDPPMILPVEDIFSDAQGDAVYRQIRTVLDTYARTLQSRQRHLLEQFTLVQAAARWSASAASAVARGSRWRAATASNPCYCSESDRRRALVLIHDGRSSRVSTALASLTRDREQLQRGRRV